MIRSNRSHISPAKAGASYTKRSLTNRPWVHPSVENRAPRGGKSVFRYRGLTDAESWLRDRSHHIPGKSARQQRRRLNRPFLLSEAFSGPERVEELSARSSLLLARSFSRWREEHLDCPIIALAEAGPFSKPTHYQLVPAIHEPTTKRL